MKKYFITGLFLFFGMSIMAQTRIGLLSVPNKATDFGIILPARSLVVLEDSNAIYRLLIKFTAAQDMNDVFVSDTNYKKISSNASVIMANYWTKTGNSLFPSAPTSDRITIGSNTATANTNRKLLIDGSMNVNDTLILGTLLIRLLTNEADPDSIPSIVNGEMRAIGVNQIVDTTNLRTIYDIANGDTTGEMLFWDGMRWIPSVGAYLKYTQSDKKLNLTENFKLEWPSGVYIKDNGEGLITNYMWYMPGLHAVGNSSTPVTISSLQNDATPDSLVSWVGGDLKATGKWQLIDTTFLLTKYDSAGFATLTEVNTRDSLAKQGIRTEYVNHDSTVIQDLRVDMINKADSASGAKGNAAGNYVTNKQLSDALLNYDVSLQNTKYTSVTGNTTYTNIVPANYILEYVVVQVTAGNTCVLDLGTTAGGSEIFAGITFTASTIDITTVPIGKVFNLSSTAQTLYLNDTGGGSTWNSASLTVIFVMRKIN